jgi:hypothetical protein
VLLRVVTMLHVGITVLHFCVTVLQCGVICSTQMSQCYGVVSHSQLWCHSAPMWCHSAPL